MKTTRAAAMAKSQKEIGAVGKRKCAVPMQHQDDAGGIIQEFEPESRS
jgi:hypothetical protein